MFFFPKEIHTQQHPSLFVRRKANIFDTKLILVWTDSLVKWKISTHLILLKSFSVHIWILTKIIGCIYANVRTFKLINWYSVYSVFANSFVCQMILKDVNSTIELKRFRKANTHVNARTASVCHNSQMSNLLLIRWLGKRALFNFSV